MQKPKTQLLTVAAVALALSSPLSAQWNNNCGTWDNCNSCFGNFRFGADFLYWTPCISNNHFAVEFEDEIIVEDDFASEAKYRFFDCDWEPGYRVYAGIDDIFGTFNLMLTYTHFDASSHKDIEGDENTLILSYPDPIFNVLGEAAEARWDLEYRHYELLIGYPCAFGQSQCFEITPFSGIQLITLKQEREEVIFGEIVGEDAVFQDIERKIEYWGAGSMLGLSYSYHFSDCLSLDGRFGGQIVIGEAKAKDRFETFGFVVVPDAPDLLLNLDNEFKSNDECFCFPGWHLRSGLTYHLDLCGWEINAKVGYEYVQWINAPTFLSYESEEFGVMSSINKSNVTFYGFFAGLEFAF